MAFDDKIMVLILFYRSSHTLYEKFCITSLAKTQCKIIIHEIFFINN